MRGLILKLPQLQNVLNCKLKTPIEKRKHLKIGFRIGSLTSRSNSSSQEKGATECVDPNLTLPTQNAFEPLSAIGKKSTRALYGERYYKQGEISVSRWADLVYEEEQVSPPPLNSKLSPEAPIFVPKSVIAKKNELGALASGILPMY
ncbi:hypothetical protein R3W88_030263 [Solanum pinnatisectum]|uniref:Uncharacterized protein n=1 Tax=Solanum pinnatisectum TaxID=50273 RepID=A0AAV9K832_9SOLN|nr:hypothetical protein R3W88_030263 [Solanum pinnatisectum]